MIKKYSALKGVVALAITSSVLGFSIGGKKSKNPGAEKPDDNRFTKVVLAQKLEEPMQMEIMKNGKVLFCERKGKLKLFDPATSTLKLVGQLAVSTKYVSKTGEITEGEDGFQGIILDPDFEENNWVYIYYSKDGKESINRLSRFEFKNDKLDVASEKKLFDVVVQREECCHVGGGMLFDKAGNLYLSTGDNTFSRASDGFTPLDEQPGKSPQDAQKSSGNTNDLRGKILRIHPEADGTYTIPEGNLFPKGTPKTRPEIYTMGNRNPWRLSIDSKTGWLHWGEVGPDGSNSDPLRGPWAFDEFNIAKKAGNYGWPYFGGNNQAYGDHDFATGKTGPKFHPERPVNNSPNNTGLQELPPTQPSTVWYPHGVSQEFPLLGSGGSSAVGGPVFRKADFKNGPKVFPEYYEGKWIVTEFARSWMIAITLDEEGNYKSMERFLPDMALHGPIDMEFGPDGSLYVLEYGFGYFKDNPEAQLIKIEYNGGNRKPIVKASAGKTAGALPLKVSLSSAGSKDFDNDELKYEWKVIKRGIAPKIYAQANPVITFTAPGIYKAVLTVRDGKGGMNSEAIEIKAGNEPPKVSFDFRGGNKSFYFAGKPITYAVKVFDKEDGSLADRRIAAGQVAVSIDYLSQGFDMAEIAQSQRSVDVTAEHAGAIKIISGSDCKACHSLNAKSLGPAFKAVALKYKGHIEAPVRLAKKIIAGGSGVWGHAEMPPHPALTEEQSGTIVKYVLSLADETKTVKSRPVTGTYTPALPENDKGKGTFIFRAAYKDKGTKLAPTQASEELVVLRSPVVPVSQSSKAEGVNFNNNKTTAVLNKRGSYLVLDKIDLTGIKQIEFGGEGINEAGIEVHTVSPSGRLIGNTSGNSVSLTNITGSQNLYFVLRSGEEVKLNTITFKN